jgi:DNA-binding transcriptional MerR regulator
MGSSLPIGDFSRATHMSIKTLRHYHRVGLLEPADVDQFTGHRRYTTQQIPTAQVIRRFRELDMPIEEIRSILAAPDVPSRNQLIAAHLSRLRRAWRAPRTPSPRCVTCSTIRNTRHGPASAIAVSPEPAPLPSPP